MSRSSRGHTLSPFCWPLRWHASDLMMGSPNSAAELREITDSIHLERAARHEPLFTRAYLKPILLAIALACFNQLSGINGILYYANDIFHAAGFSNLSGSLQTVMIGLMNLVA